MATSRTYAGVPVAERRQERRRRLLDAGLEEIGTRGFDAVTVKDVCRQAGLTERYFYEHFADRRALLHSVYDDVAATVMGVAFSAAEAAPMTLEDRARAGLSAFISALADDPRRARIQLIESVGRGPALERRRAEVMGAFADYLALAADQLHPRPEIPTRRRRALALGLVGAINHLAVEWVLGDLKMERRELERTLVTLMLAVADAPTLSAAASARAGVGQ